LILLGLFNAAAFGLQIFGQKFTTAGKTALLIDLNIIFVAILSKIFLKEHLNRFKILGIILGLIGAYFLTIGFNSRQLLLGNIIGDLIILASGFIWSFYIVLSRSILREDNIKKINFLDFSNIINLYTLVFGLIPFIFMIFMNIEILIVDGSLIVWLLIIHLGLNCSLIAFLLFHKGLRNTSSILASIILLIEVLTANIFGMIFLPHVSYFTIDFLIGAIFIISAVIVCSFSKTENKDNK
jgi:drug/metabolite transporter (DMT)-like permease